MKAFESFIESDAFFPVLIVLLILLVAVFLWAILSSKKEAKERKLRKQNLQLDESAEIKFIEDQNAPRSTEEKEKEEVEEVETNEIRIIEEQEVAPGVNESEMAIVNEVDLSELPTVDIPIPNVTEESFEIPAVEIDEENSVQKESVIIEFSKKAEENKGFEDNLEISKKDENQIVNAFSVTPDDIRDINENITIEPINEYTGEKTEIFEFPDFDEMMLENLETNDEDIENSIIEAANKYIESVMNKN